MSQVTVSLNVVLNAGGLHEVRVHPVLLPHPVQPLRVTLGVDTGLGPLHKCIDLLVGGDGGHGEEAVGGAAAVGAVLDLGLLGQVLGRVDGRGHLGAGEEGGEVSSVGGDHDEGEEPPHASHHASGDGSKILKKS